jgi:SAM-dependent methyltransferase
LLIKRLQHGILKSEILAGSRVMNKFLRGIALAVVEAFDLPSPVMEIGSYQVEGQEELINLRSVFPNSDYLGVDIREGPGVDLVADVEDLPQPDDSVGTIIALNTFEHVKRFWRGFDEVHRVLRPDGAFFVSTPFNVQIHNYPNDYWRFTPEAFQLLLEDYPTRIIGWHGPEEKPENVWAIAFREEAPDVTPEQFARFQSLIAKHARQPLRWQRRLRYRLFDWVDRRRYCAPLLEQEKWDCQLFTNGQLVSV